MANQYAERDASELDDVGGYYIRHVSAMTKEGLHSKGDVAAELGFRDMQIDTLTKQRDDLLEALQGMVDIASDSQGVAGYHLNGAMADWDEFEEWQAACDAIAKAKAGAVNHFPDAAKMVPGGLWQLVPVEPTSKMRDAFHCAQEQWEEGEYYAPDHQWQAMLSAAPKLEGGAA